MDMSGTIVRIDFSWSSGKNNLLGCRVERLLSILMLICHYRSFCIFSHFLQDDSSKSLPQKHFGVLNEVEILLAGKILDMFMDATGKLEGSQALAS